MAKLHRFVRLDDRFDTHIFTFLLPPSLALHTTPGATTSAQDTVSRDFMYAHQKWTLSVERGDLHAGVYVNLDNVYEGMTVTVDLSVTLVNQDHFARNESYVEKDCAFTSRRSSVGRKSFVAVTELVRAGYQILADQCNLRSMEKPQPTFEFNAPAGPMLLEVEMRNCRTTFQQVSYVGQHSFCRTTFQQVSSVGIVL